jgi:hypothetical protein
MALLVDRAMPDQQRVSAAVTAVALASHACAVDDIKEVHRLTRDALRNPDVDIAQRATVDMIYHVSCGDLNDAINASKELLTARRASGSAAEVVHALRCTAQVAGYAGDWRGATAYLHDAVQLAEKHCLATQAIRACGMLAEHAFGQLSFQTSAEWHSRAVSWAQSTDDRLLQAINELFAAKLALAQGDLTGARAHLASQHIPHLATTLYSGRIDALAVRLHAHLAHGDTVAARDRMAAFESAFLQLLPFGDLDYAAVVRYLCAAEDEVTGYERLLAYATVQRRERGPLSPLLQATLDRRASPFSDDPRY